MNIAIIGAGFTGLSAAYELTTRGHSVTVYESDDKPGGLAVGFQKKGWEWSVEKHYHHWFTNDHHILQLAHRLKHEVIVKRPKTSVYVDGKVFQMDSAANVLSFPLLDLTNRLRMGLTLALLRLNPFWQPLENFRASDVLLRLMGEKAYDLLWKPLLFGKFGTAMDEVSLAWFWARIAKRTPSLAYPVGGFLAFAKNLQKHIEDNGGTIVYNATVTRLEKISSGNISVIVLQGKRGRTRCIHDNVLVTLPSFSFIKMATLPQKYIRMLRRLRGLGAINLILRLKRPFLTDGTYWLNICEPRSPALAIVEHTNFMDKRNYNNEHLVYVGNYVPYKHPYFSMSKSQLLATFDPLLRSLNAHYQMSLIGTELFKAPFAQPIISVHYSRMIPPFTTPLKNVYLANIQQVYPWDRGTTHAIELGQKVAHLISNYARS